MKKRLGMVAGINSWKHDHKIVILIVGAILISLILVGISLWLYESSGAAQLDLSRREYSSVRDKADNRDKIEAFPSTGVVDEKTIEEFEEIFNHYADEAFTADAFSGDALGDAQLGIDPPAEIAP